MKPFGSKRTYYEWRFTKRKSSRLRKVHRDGKLDIKSRKSGRKYQLSE